MNNYVVGAYIRLSKEDGKNSESESISNQRYLIREYLKHRDLNIDYEYVDDGFSGTNFDRPAFKRLINDIETGKINMVVTKDLSRLGRNYLKSGYYIEEYFPLKRVRYIAILDNVDTFLNDNDIAPFKALFNEMMAKDTSRKIKSILENKKRQGMYLASFAPYGYKKDSKDKHKLVIDKKSAKNVKMIFMMFLKGYSIIEIVTYLNLNNVPSPSKYKGINDNLWSYSSVYNVLKNKTYIGTTIQNKWTNISYKNKTRIKRNKEEWIVNKHDHKGIINKKDFFFVQEKLHRNKNHHKKRKKRLLEGLLYCMECGKSLGFNYNKKCYIICNGYKKNTLNCTSHYMEYDLLEKEIIKRIKFYLNNIKEYQITRELLFMLIENIVIDKNKKVFIKYKFKKPC